MGMSAAAILAHPTLDIRIDAPSNDHGPTIRLGRPLSEAVDHVQHDAALRLLPVVDHAGRPAGAIYERDMRLILFNPFGHGLLRNPSFGGRLDDHVRFCARIDRGADGEQLVDAYAAQTADTMAGIASGGQDPGRLDRGHRHRVKASGVACKWD